MFNLEEEKKRRWERRSPKICCSLLRELLSIFIWSERGLSGKSREHKYKVFESENHLVGWGFSSTRRRGVQKVHHFPQNPEKHFLPGYFRGGTLYLWRRSRGMCEHDLCSLSAPRLAGVPQLLAAPANDSQSMGQKLRLSNERQMPFWLSSM